MGDVKRKAGARSLGDDAARVVILTGDADALVRGRFGTNRWIIRCNVGTTRAGTL